VSCAEAKDYLLFGKLRRIKAEFFEKDKNFKKNANYFNKKT